MSHRIRADIDAYLTKVLKSCHVRGVHGEVAIKIKIHDGESKNVSVSVDDRTNYNWPRN